MQNLTEVAQSFEQNAKQQREASQKAIESEFQTLNTVIKQESTNAVATYKHAIRELNCQHWVFGTLSALPLNAVFVMGGALTAWLCLNSQYALVKTYTYNQKPAQWAQCLSAPQALKNGTILCVVKED